jgi:CubicO group peptidase (beta-lactamase class C family)
MTPSRAHSPIEVKPRPTASRRTFAWSVLALSAVVALLATSLTATGLSPAKPEDLGFSSGRLARVTDVVQRHITEGRITGAVTLVARRGQIAYFEAQGLMDREAKTPMRKDAIFRIASMSKPITGVAVMMLVEEGKLRLTDPVSRFIPEFKDTKVAVPKAGAVPAAAPVAGQPPRSPEADLVSAQRAVTVRDLLTHTSGLASGGLGTREANRIANRETTSTLAPYVARLGTAPLDFQPGTEWRYSALAGIDVLGRIVEVASGLTFDQFLRQRIFEPLGMKDTGFSVPADRHSRIVTLYGRTQKGLERQDTPAWLATSTLFSGGGGLWSTAEDYVRFAQMLVAGGELDGTRLLGPRTVARMAANHVGDKYTGTSRSLRGMGFGLTMEVVLDEVESGQARSTGSFGWDGAFGTHFWVDPKESMVGILMVQTPGSGLTRDVEHAVMQAIVE